MKMRLNWLMSLAVCGAMVWTASAATLFSNGSIVTNPGAGAGGFDVSQASADFNTQGFSVASPTRLADDFVVPAPGWRVDSVTVSAYIVGTYSVPPAGSPFTALTLSLWRGAPDEPTSQLVATSSTLAGNQFSGTFRVGNGAANFGNTQRPVFNLTASFPQTELLPGEHWIEYSVTGTGGITFSPMVMDGTPAVPITRNGNARRRLDPTTSWITLFGGVVSQGVDFPFVVSGSVIPEPAGAALLAAMGVLTRRRRR